MVTEIGISGSIPSPDARLPLVDSGKQMLQTSNDILQVVTAQRKGSQERKAIDAEIPCLRSAAFATNDSSDRIYAFV